MGQPAFTRSPLTGSNRCTIAPLIETAALSPASSAVSAGRRATWLTAAERSWLETKLAQEQAEKQVRHGYSLAQVFGNGRVIPPSLVNFCYIVGSMSVGVWMPQVVKGFGLSNLQVGFVTAIPYLAGAIAWCCGPGIPTARRNAPGT